LAGREPVGVEVATTMPIPRLHALVGRMYDAQGEFGKIDRLYGNLRIGGVPGSGQGAVNARVFPLHGRGTDHARFASSFVRDTGYRDFACHCVYYDPVNKVLIDPTGRALTTLWSTGCAWFTTRICNLMRNLGALACAPP
jgi:hypothetical protein